MSSKRAITIKTPWRQVQPASPGEASQTFAEWLAASASAAGPTRYWPLDDTSGPTIAPDIGGINATAQNNYEYDVKDIDAGSWAGFDGATSLPAHATIASPITSQQFTALMTLQLDAVRSKHIPLTMGQGLVAGTFSLELIDDGAGGIKPRCYSVSSTPAFVVYAGTAAATVPVGTPFRLIYRRGAGTQEVWTVLPDGTVTNIPLTLQSGTPPGSWPAVPSGTWYAGAWSSGADPLNGCMRDLVLWDSALPDTDIISLGTVTDQPVQVVSAKSFEAVEVEASQTRTISLADYVHPESGYTVGVVSQPSLGSASDNDLQIDYDAGATPGDDDTFTYKITLDANDSPTRTITIDVIAPPAPADEPWNGLGVGCHSESMAFANLPIRVNNAPIIRFQAERTGQVRGVRTLLRYNGAGQSGYSNGDGGTIRCDLYQDNGSGLPGTKIGTGETIVDPITSLSESSGNNKIDELQLTDSTLPTVTAGQTYHWVYVQSNGTEYLSVNTSRDNHHDVDNDMPNNSGAGMCPIFGNTFAMLRGSLTGALRRPGYVPFFSTVYSDDAHTGCAWGSIVRTDRKSVDGQNRLRAVMTPTTNRDVRYVWVKMYKRTNQTTLDVTATVKNSGGSTLATATFSASAIGYDPQDGLAGNYTQNNDNPQTSGGEYRQAPWLRATLSTPLTLTGGQTYYVELNAASGADVWMFSMKDNTSNLPFEDPRQAEVRGQFSSDGGSGWTNAWDHGSPNNATAYAIMLHYN